DAEPRPVTHYGKSKLEAERAVRHSLPDAVIVRPPVVYGPRDRDVFQLLKSISKGLVLEIAGGERGFSAIYVKDLCAGLVAAGRGGGGGWGRGVLCLAPQATLVDGIGRGGGAYFGADATCREDSDSSGAGSRGYCRNVVTGDGHPRHHLAR